MMKRSRLLPLIGGMVFGTAQLAFADATFTVNDTPGYWFDTGNDIAGTRSLAIIAPNEKVFFKQTQGQPRDVESRHTVTSLIWPSDAPEFAPGRGVIDQEVANKENHEVTLTTPGLYVFVCKLHPYMLGGVIVNDAATPGLDLGANLTLLGPTPAGHVSFPTATDLGLRLLRAFFVVTNPGNWKDYTKVGTIYQPVYPSVDVNAGNGIVVNLKDAIEGLKIDGQLIAKQEKPRKKGIVEIWVDTAYELTKDKPEWTPGTMTVVSATGWNVKRKIALPEQKMNNGHNMWASHDQKQIYQTEWHGKSLYVLNRRNGKLLQELDANGQCNDPAHVMTRVDTQQVHVTCNGENTVAEYDRLPDGRLSLNQFIPMSDGTGKQTQPHAHWMGFDGKSMATPNSNSNDSTLFNFDGYSITNKQPTGALPIAAGMMPDSSKYYVSNYLGHTTSVMCGPRPNPVGSCVPGTKIKDIPLLLNGNYDPATGPKGGPIGALPIQTPVSPDGKFVITGNTLTGTITIIDTKTDTLVKMIACDPGCHGVNFGAKKGGGYYAYVTSKFANRLIVLDYDPDNDGNVDDAEIAGAVVLARDNVPKDDKIVGNKGQGGQGVLPVPNVYNGWVQELPIGYRAQLTKEQRNPIGPIGGGNPHDDDDDDHGQGHH